MITDLTDVAKKILAVFGDPTVIHRKPEKSKDAASLSSTRPGSAFLSVGLVWPPTTLQTLPIMSSRIGPAQTPLFSSRTKLLSIKSASC